MSEERNVREEKRRELKNRISELARWGVEDPEYEATIEWEYKCKYHPDMFLTKEHALIAKIFAHVGHLDYIDIMKNDTLTYEEKKNTIYQREVALGHEFRDACEDDSDDYYLEVAFDIRECTYEIEPY